VIAKPLDTRWMIWLTCVTIVVWVAIAQKFRRLAAPQQSRVPILSTVETDCERFPDQCPCTTELGKGIASQR
jgi:hypothetical protein